MLCFDSTVGFSLLVPVLIWTIWCKRRYKFEKRKSQKTRIFRKIPPSKTCSNNLHNSFNSHHKKKFHKEKFFYVNKKKSFFYQTLTPVLQSHSFSQSYRTILPTSLIYIILINHRLLTLET